MSIFSLRNLSLFFLLGLIGCYTTIACAEQLRGVDKKFLLELNADWQRTHEGSPMGVPSNFRWATRPQLEAGNQPGIFAATTGWGQVYWSKGTIGNPGPVQIRNFQVYLCHGPSRQWERIQSGDIEGAEYRGDFKDDASKPAPRFETHQGVATVSFDAGKTFHFWLGRARLPKTEICGFLALVEARAPEMATRNSGGERVGGYLVGLGADYWINMNAPWDNFKTNKGVGLGRLKYVGSDWAWFGFSTASDEDLQRIYANGYSRSEAK